MAIGIVEIIIFLVIGAIAGWLASILVRGRGFGLLGDIVVGIVGALIGGLLFGRSDVTSLYGFIAALLGAVIFLAIVKLIRRV